MTTQNEMHGLVRPWERGRSFNLERLSPSPALERIIERHWIVQWDLRGRPAFRQETLPHPSVNLVIEPGGAWVWGVPTERDTRMLHGQGWAVGTKFQPGAFTAVTGIAASRITDHGISLPAALGPAAASLERRSSATPNPHAIVADIEALLAPLAPLPAVERTSIDLIAAVIESMRSLPPTARVEELAILHHLAPRTLQRLFRRYVGVGPKWVLKRLRIHLATERLNATHPPSWTDLALDLGYYDHAHFIRDFRLIVGRSPAEYAAEAARARAK
jgi:AraC-like DNA-binding protein